MQNAFVAFITTLLLGITGMFIDSIIGMDGNFSVVLAMATMGAFVLYAIDDRKKNANKTLKRIDVRRLVFTALMAALSIVLSETLKFKLPIMPSFMTFDFSDVPAMLASLTMGPVSGVTVCLIKNVFGCFTTSTGCVGELSNFILSAALVLPAGIITHKNDKISLAVIGSVVGSILMALISIASNYFLVFPAYSKAYGMPMDAIVGLYQKILPSVDSVMDCLVIFNMPFTFAKGGIAAIVSVVLYKKLRPIFNSLYREIRSERAVGK